MKKKKEFVWTTRDGKKLKLHGIEDSHLLNIYKFLSKQINELKDLQNFSYSPFAPIGEIASEELEKAVEESYQLEMRSFNTREIIVKEIEKRRLSVPVIKYRNEWAEATKRIEYIKQPAFNGVGRLIKMR